MNDKQQLAAMGEHMAEQAAQPMCMAKRIEELEAQVRVMRELLTRSRPYISDQADWGRTYEKGLLRDIDAALSGKLPTPSAPEGWKMVPVEPTDDMYDAGKTAGTGEVCKTWDGNGYEFGSPAPIYEAMLASAPSLDSAK